MVKNECKNCIHFEVCAYALPGLPTCDSFVDKEPRSKRFIILSSDDLDKIRNNQVVTCENCDFSSVEPPYDIFCVSEGWYKEYSSN